MASKSQLELKIEQINRTRQELMIKTRVFHQLLMFMDYTTRKEVKTFSIFSLCGGERSKFMVDLYFQNAFNDLTAQEKVALYEKTVQYAVEFEKAQSLPAQSRVQVIVEDESRQSPQKKKPITFRLQIHKGFGSWSSWSVIYLSLEGFKLASQNLLQIDLRNYLLRKSKKTDRECHALQAIRQTEPQVIRFCFLSNSDKNQIKPIIEGLIDRGYREMIKRMLNVEICSSISTNVFFKMGSPILQLSDSVKKTGILSKSEYRQEEVDYKAATSKFTLAPQSKPSHKKQSQAEPSVVEQILKEHEEQYLDDELANIIDEQNEKARQEQEMLEESRARSNGKQIQKYHKNVFAVIFPLYHLDTLQDFSNLHLVYNNNGTCIFQSHDNPLLFRMNMQPKVNALFALRAILDVPLYEHWHPQVVHGHVNLRISSENSAIVYQKNRGYSKWYRERDFLYLRHVFRQGDSYFIADKSIENSHFIPFQTIQRGKIAHQITKITPDQKGCRVTIDCLIEYGGLLSQTYMQELTQRYLLGFAQIEPLQQMKKITDRMVDYFRIDWVVSQMVSQQSLGRHTDTWEVQSLDVIEQQVSCSSLKDEDLYFSIKDHSERRDSQLESSIHEIQQQQLPVKYESSYMQKEAQVIELDEDGHVALPRTYLTTHHPQAIHPNQPESRIVLKHEDMLRKDHWIMDERGGFILVNKQIIAAQDNVLSFVMTTLKKNLLSGKGLNISLPVTLFNCDSMLQRLCFCLGLAPDYLQQAARLQSHVQRMKYCLIFGLSNSLLFFDVEKPFNPILGQTYQGFIAGCPVYAEQVSHHPPITAIYLIGRGYKVFGSIQGTVNMHLNSADGINLGWYHILFDDGQQVCFQTPPAQFTGLAMGLRKFNFKDKGYYYDKINQLYAEMNFEDQAGIFSSNKWKFRDQFQVQLQKVTPEFLDKFISNFPSKKIAPSKKDTLESYFRLEGRWPFNICCEGQVLYSVNGNLPHALIDYQYPLNSNSNYREDLQYRKKNDLSRSQSEKERLEILQRQDKKLREKYCPKQKH